jgi:hypothetical protein
MRGAVPPAMYSADNRCVLRLCQTGRQFWCPESDARFGGTVLVRELVYLAVST